MNARVFVGLDNACTRYKVLVATVDGRERIERQVDECGTNDRSRAAKE